LPDNKSWDEGVAPFVKSFSALSPKTFHTWRHDNLTGWSIDLTVYDGHSCSVQRPQEGPPAQVIESEKDVVYE
jgi:hypothetical protein